MLKTFPETPGEATRPPAWIDLINPNESEIALVQNGSGVRVPTLHGLSEIETSSRAYVEGGVLYLSTPLVAHAGAGHPELTPVGFVLTQNLLVTVRFSEISVFDAEAARVGPKLTAIEAFACLFEGIVDRSADLLELAGADLDKIAKEIFSTTRRTRGPGKADPLRNILNSVGVAAARLSQIRDSLLGGGRVLAFVCERAHDWLSPEQAVRLNVMRQDILSLDDYETHLANKTQFLLDAVLGLISVEQNDIFKILTLVSVVGIPPTLMASIYGMNFHYMPELAWRYGYPFGLVVILVSTLLPLAWFKWKGWF